MIYQKFTYKTGTFQWLCQFTRGSFFRSGDLAPWLGDRGYSRDYSTQYIEDDHNPLRESLVTEGTQSISYGFFLLQEDVGQPVIFLFVNGEKDGGFSTA